MAKVEGAEIETQPLFFYLEGGQPKQFAPAHLNRPPLRRRAKFPRGTRAPA